jgi:hypothetical protein
MKGITDMTNVSTHSTLTKSLIAKRVQVGADTPIGRRLSMLVEQINNGVSPVQTIREIEQIQRDGGQYVHGNHGAVR